MATQTSPPPAQSIGVACTPSPQKAAVFNVAEYKRQMAAQQQQQQQVIRRAGMVALLFSSRALVRASKGATRPSGPYSVVMWPARNGWKRWAANMQGAKGFRRELATHVTA